MKVEDNERGQSDSVQRVKSRKRLAEKYAEYKVKVIAVSLAIGSHLATSISYTMERWKR